jgi:hypothetical protein
MSNLICENLLSEAMRGIKIKTFHLAIFFSLRLKKVFRIQENIFYLTFEF